MKYSIVIATYNRAADLRETLKSLAGLQPDGPWEVIVVDNNSPDDTRAGRPGSRAVVSGAAALPVRARTGPQPGAQLRHPGRRRRHHRDDRRRRARAGGLAEPGGRRARAARCDYVGGRVLPIWGGPRPAWLPDHGGKQWAVIALLDYGPEPIEFGTRVPLGVNMAFRRSAFDRAGGFDPHTGTARRHAARTGSPRVVHPGAQGRRPRLLRPRARRCGTSSRPNRLNKRVLPPLVLLARHQPRAALRALRTRHGSAGADHARLLDGAAPLRRAALSLSQGLRALRLAGSQTRCAAGASRAFEHELWLCFFAGIVRQRFRDIARASDAGCRSRQEHDDRAVTAVAAPRCPAHRSPTRRRRSTRRS